jgi:hypothetical protein
VKRFAAAAIVFVCATTLAPIAGASTYTQPRDSASKLAIKSVSDTTQAQTVTYRIETYAGWDNVKDFSIIRWYFDLAGKGKFTEMCILLEGVGDGRLRAEFYPKCGPVVWSTAEARKPAANVVEFDLLIRDLINGGGVVPGQPLHYRVYSEDFNGGHDWAPPKASSYLVQAPLPHLSRAELTGGVSNGSTASSAAAGEASGQTTPSTGGPFSTFGGLPVAAVLLITLVLAGGLYLVWRLVAARLAGGDRGGAVHSRDT